VAPRLEVKSISRSFAGREAVRDVSLAVSPGQVVCLLGPSGCGKTTTLRAIAGVETVDTGEILVDGAVVAGPGVHMPPEQRGVGLMFQDFALFPHLTVVENVGFGLKRRAKDPKVAMLLERLEIDHLARAYPHQLSGGEQQRTALARAVAPGPKVMLMDEPFSGLDERLRDEVREATLEVLREAGTAVVLVTHDPSEAMGMADEIALLRRGRVVQQGPPYTMYTAPGDREAAGFFSNINVLDGVVRGALVATPFGDLLAPGHADGAEVEVVIRPQNLRIDFDRAGQGPHPTDAMGQAARAKVVRARFLGQYSVIDFALESDGTRLSATLPSVFLPRPGTMFWLLAPRKHCHIFPKG